MQLAYAGSGVLLLAAGDVAACGGVAAGAWWARGVPAPLAAVAGLAVAAVVAGVLEVLVVRTTRGSPVRAAVGLAAAAAVVRQALVAVFPNAAYPFAGVPGVAHLAGGVVRASDGVAVAGALLLTAVAALVLLRTRAGAALRVTAAGAAGAEAIGVDTRRVRLAAFACAGALAAAGAILAAPRLAPSPGGGAALTAKALAAALAGGIASPVGAVGGAVALGTAEAVLGYQLGGGGEALTLVLAVLLIALRVGRGR